jgi:hypothetical protein
MKRAAGGAIAAIHSRLNGAERGQLALAETAGARGQLAVVEPAQDGQVSISRTRPDEGESGME